MFDTFIYDETINVNIYDEEVSTHSFTLMFDTFIYVHYDEEVMKIQEVRK